MGTGERPPQVSARYASIGLRAEGARPSHWLVDGRAVAGERWILKPGRHEIRAVSVDGDTAAVRIEVR
jgi:hypothetical protein